MHVERFDAPAVKLQIDATCEGSNMLALRHPYKFECIFGYFLSYMYAAVNIVAILIV